MLIYQNTKGGFIDDVRNGYIAKKITEVPNLVKALGVAYENLRTEEETKMARGGMVISSSMDADNN